MDAHRHPGALALGGLTLTGLLTGGVTYGGLLVGSYVDGRSGEVGAAIAVAGVLGSLVLLGAALRPLARAAGQPAWAYGAPIGLAATLPVSFGLWVQLLSAPYEAAFCVDAPGMFCSLGVLIFVPTAASLPVWATAGAPWIVLMVLLARRRRTRRATV